MSAHTPEHGRYDAIIVGAGVGGLYAIHRLRKRFRELIHAEISQTVDEPQQVEAELRYLVEVLSRR